MISVMLCIKIHKAQVLITSLKIRLFQARSQNCGKRLSASSCPSVRLSVRIKQLGAHWTVLLKFDI